jgi:hypothetical protein
MHIVSSSSFRHGILIFVLSDRRRGRAAHAHPLPLLRPGTESSHRWPSAENLRGILEVSTPRCKHVLHCIFFFLILIFCQEILVAANRSIEHCARRMGNAISMSGSKFRPSGLTLRSSRASLAPLCLSPFVYQTTN